MNECRSKRIFEFGPYRLDVREKLLSHNGAEISLTPKVFEVLRALVENHGHVLGKEELLDRVWPDAFVEVGNLNRNISTLRAVLGDDSHNPRFIRTLPKVGYRFEAEVREKIVDANGFNGNGLPKDHSLNDEPVDQQSAEGRFGSRKVGIALAIVVGLAIISLAWAYAGRSSNSDSTNAEAPALKESNAHATELYRKGRLLWQDRSGVSLHDATLLLEQSVAADPNFALGYAALADAYAFDGQNHGKAIETAETAIRLDPTLGEPHATIGFVKMFWEWKFYEADKYFKRAVTLSPGYATGHQWYALNLVASGRGGAAQSEMQKALELEPDSLAINADMCQLLYFSRRLDEAEVRCKKTLEIDPKFLNANLQLYEIYSAKGMYDEAVAQFFRNEKLVVHYASFPGELDELRAAYAKGGINAYWRKRIEMLQKLPSNDYVIAKYHARLGENDKVFYRLRKTYEAHDLNFMNFLAEPLFLLCCYSDPRFAELEGHLITK